MLDADEGEDYCVMTPDVTPCSTPRGFASVQITPSSTPRQATAEIGAAVGVLQGTLATLADVASRVASGSTRLSAQAASGVGVSTTARRATGAVAGAARLVTGSVAAGAGSVARGSGVLESRKRQVPLARDLSLRVRV